MKRTSVLSKIMSFSTFIFALAYTYYVFSLYID